MQILVPYGPGEALRVDLPDERVAGIIHPNQVSVADREQVLERALSQPLGSVTLDQFLKDAGELLILVNDATRPTPTAEVLRDLAPRLSELRIQFLVATGSHRGPTEEESRRIFGPLYERYSQQIAIHDARRSDEMVSIGTSQRGTELSINRRVLDAPRILVIGSVEPHYFAGYTGGRKAFLPGVAGFQTIEQNHRLALRKEAQSLVLEGNPVHEDMVDVLKPLADKQIFAIHTVLDREHRIYACTAGDLQLSFA
ncbi:lactate racemase domain-containing protein, partial [Candidatus Zixiibacteriota bacterium]